jgi:hypothetical protein
MNDTTAAPGTETLAKAQDAADEVSGVSQPEQTEVMSVQSFDGWANKPALIFVTTRRHAYLYDREKNELVQIPFVAPRAT